MDPNSNINYCRKIPPVFHPCKQRGVQLHICMHFKVVSHEHLLSYYILLTKLNFGLAFATQGSGIFEASR